MAVFNFKDWQAREATKPQQNNGGFPTNSQRVGYFSLRNNGQEAIVRFMYDSPDDFVFADVHKVQVADKLRTILCVGTPSDPAGTCPLCASGNQRKTSFYIYIVEYVKDENGKVVGVPKVWERSASYARKLVEYFNEYGPLSDIVFKVKRNGATGDKNTTYDIMPANPAVYRSDLYPKMEDAFRGFTIIGNVASNWSVDKMKELLGGDGNTAEVTQKETVSPVQPTQTYQPAPQPVQNQYVPQEPRAEVAQPRQYQVPVQSQQQFDRPRRHY